MAGKRDRLSGNEAIAIALRQINPDVFPAFPITPSTEIPQYFASFVANGQVDTEFIPVESEHSSMSAAIGASAAGARSLTSKIYLPTYTATHHDPKPRLFSKRTALLCAYTLFLTSELLRVSLHILQKSWRRT